MRRSYPRAFKTL